MMLQEVRQELLQVILGHPWVQRNFLVSNVNPPESEHTNIPGEFLQYKKARLAGSSVFYSHDDLKATGNKGLLSGTICLDYGERCSCS